MRSTLGTRIANNGYDFKKILTFGFLIRTLQEHPLVSIIVPTFNRYVYLVDTIKSILAQTYSNFELIIVSDASSDETINLQNEFADPRMQFYTLAAKSNGPAPVRNYGISKSTGELIAFCDDDDLWAPYKLERQISTFLKNPSICLVASNVRYFSSGDISHKQLFFLKNLFNHLSFIGPKYLIAFYNCIVLSSSMIRKDVLLSYGCFNDIDEYQGHEDNDLWLKICSRHHVSIITDPLVFYRVHTAQLSTAMNKSYKKQSLKIMKRHYTDFNILQKAIFKFRLFIYWLSGK